MNINEIASAKIKQMEESGEIRKRIEEGVEKTINEAIDSACKSYEFRNGISENVKGLLGEVAKSVNFSAYANFLKDRINEQIEKYVKNDMINLMRDSFEKMYFNIPENIKLSDILNKYKEYLEKYLDADDKREWGYIKFSFEKEYSCFIKISAGFPKDTMYSKSNETLNMSLYIPHSTDRMAVISWIELGGENFKTSIDLAKNLSEFEVLMFNLMFTRTYIEVDIDEDFCFDTDYEDEEEY